MITSTPPFFYFLNHYILNASNEISNIYAVKPLDLTPILGIMLKYRGLDMGATLTYGKYPSAFKLVNELVRTETIFLKTSVKSSIQSTSYQSLRVSTD